MPVESSPLQRFAKTALCTGLTASEIEALFELCEVRRLDATKRLFSEGEPADALWVVLEGDVEISREGQVLAEVGPGSVLGELSLFRAVPRRSASVTTLCPVTVVRLPGPVLQRRLAARDVVALMVVSNLAHQMADRLQALNDVLLSGGRKGLAVARTALRRVVG